MTVLELPVPRPAIRCPFDALSSRELEVLELLALGLSNAGVAERLWLSERTVEAHVGRILAKLHIPEGRGTSRRVLAVLAYLSA